jgi:hypothetical protein
MPVVLNIRTLAGLLLLLLIALVVVGQQMLP